jgi:hypothetical protein
MNSSQSDLSHLFEGKDCQTGGTRVRATLEQESALANEASGVLSSKSHPLGRALSVQVCAVRTHATIMIQEPRREPSISPERALEISIAQSPFERARIERFSEGSVVKDQMALRVVSMKKETSIRDKGPSRQRSGLRAGSNP